MNKYEEIRKALEMNPTPGPWEVYDCYVQQEDNTELGICDVLYMDKDENGNWYEGDVTKANKKFIAACHPEVIQSLLAERDALYEALKEKREMQ